jgi:chromosome partitioning protein
MSHTPRVILVANIKGGCGKTTVATHLAVAAAAAGHRTVLADLDRQRSSFQWAGRRPGGAVPVVGVDWTRDLGDPPAGTDRLVLDAPAALKARQVEDLVRLADAVVVPVLPGAFDEGATRRYLDRLEELKAIKKGRIPVAIVGNRVKARTRAAAGLDRFLAGVGHTVVTRLRDSQLYADAAAQGLAVLDLTGSRPRDVRGDWAPLLAWIETVV